MKFHSATLTEQIWANQSSVKCTVLVMVQNAYKFLVRSETNSVHYGVESLCNSKEKNFAPGTKYDLLIFMKNWDQRSKSG